MVITYSSTIKFVPECFITQEMCHEEVNRCLFVFDYIPDWYKTQDMCEWVISEDPFLTVYCRDEYITQKMCDEAIDDSMTTMKLTPDWFVSSKMTLKIFLLLFILIKVYSILTKVLLMSYFLVMKWVILI